MEFDNWYEKIRRNRDNFIDYYVKQFGEENRNLIMKRFDSLKFCFYINPNDIKYWCALQLNDDYVIATYQFLKSCASELNIDISSISLDLDKTDGEIFLKINDEKIEKKINALFGIGTIGHSYEDDDFNFFNLYSFRELTDFIKGEGKNYVNPQQKLIERQLLFLSDIGEITIKGIPSDYFKTEECDQFINSVKFKKLTNKYQKLAKIALKFKKEVDVKYQSLIDYMNKSLLIEQKIFQKYDNLKQGENDLAKIKEYEQLCKKAIAKSRIVCGNFDFSNSLNEEVLDCILDSVDTQFTITGNDENYLDSVILFCPFRSIPGYEDVDLRHEIRHAMTSSITKNKNTTIFKIGNKIEILAGEECIESYLSDYNEWVTQIEAKKETKDAFSKGIYIISKPSLKNHNFVGKTSYYDKFLSFFEIIYNTLPVTAKQSQIEVSNESLYNVISLKQLTDIEKMIVDGVNGVYDDKLEEKLYTISRRITNYYNQISVSKNKLGS